MLLQISNQAKLQQYPQLQDYSSLGNRRVSKNGSNISSQIYTQKKVEQKRALTPVKTSGQKIKQFSSPQIKSIKTMTNVGSPSVNPIFFSPIQLTGQSKAQLPPLMAQSAITQLSRKTVFIGKGNNDQLIREFFEKRGWVVLDSSLKFWTKFNLKWVQNINEIDWQFFHEGNQISLKIKQIEFKSNIMFQNQYIFQFQLILQAIQLINYTLKSSIIFYYYFLHFKKEILFSQLIIYYLKKEDLQQILQQYKYSFKLNIKQKVNHIQNISIIATKNGLVQTIKDFECKDKYLASSYGLHSSQFIPETYRLDVTRDEYSIEEQTFLNLKNGGLWINKPTNFNCGKGIQMISDIKKFKDEFSRLKSQSFSLRQGKTIASSKFQFFHKKQSPLLLDKKKFDMRCYVLIASTEPYFVLFNHGYLRLSMNDYNKENVDDNNEKFTHLTNAAIQKKHPNFQIHKENTIWSMEKFEVNQLKLIMFY